MRDGKNGRNGKGEKPEVCDVRNARDVKKYCEENGFPELSSDLSDTSDLFDPSDTPDPSNPSIRSSRKPPDQSRPTAQTVSCRLVCVWTVFGYCLRRKRRSRCAPPAAHPSASSAMPPDPAAGTPRPTIR